MVSTGVLCEPSTPVRARRARTVCGGLHTAATASRACDRKRVDHEAQSACAPSAASQGRFADSGPDPETRGGGTPSRSPLPAPAEGLALRYFSNEFAFLFFFFFSWPTLHLLFEARLSRCFLEPSRTPSCGRLGRGFLRGFPCAPRAGVALGGSDGRPRWGLPRGGAGAVLPALRAFPLPSRARCGSHRYDARVADEGAEARGWPARGHAALQRRTEA